ncbi:beta-ketoacyl synthase N-terminal-like domain-containing protein [Leptothoe sp. LEGE 181152]|nr:beta-ketoacyl synthase N-terminal-like domain-containing protein [Leptothoe sp. LEGE 181152]
MVGTSADREALETIAIIGMSCRFPGADSPKQFWQNLSDGIESIYFFSDQEHNHLGKNQAWVNEPNYVKADPCLEDVEWFDASFFNLNARQAELTSPEHRIFLECAWEALEHGGYTTQHYDGSVGVYAGSNISHYLKFTGQEGLLQPTMSGVEASFGNDLNYMSTLVSYHLNLKGPSMMVQTACSSALVAIHMAGQSLLNGECDMALAGAINLRGPQKTGYFYQEGGILSPDGHCRAFDAKAQGTVPGSGAGVVLLKRFSDALEDGDHIHAVIRGSAINNDGASKVGYSAPSVDGQAVVIADALAIAEIDPKTVTYIEAHGTGTVLGDPIEVAALTDVFRVSTDQKGFCAIGSVKSNVGHLGVAAGMPGLIKVALALENQTIPPSLNFEQPNPKIDFANSPFYVNHTLSEWHANGTPRRAGVSSLGVGGTNAHIVLEEAPSRQPSGSSRPWQLMVISAKTQSALDKSTANLANYLSQHPDVNLADVAYTLSIGRQAFEHRRILICQHLDQAQKQFESLDPEYDLTQHQTPHKRPIIFMFSGQGAQYINMARELYQQESIFQEHVDTCATYLYPLLGLDLRHILYPDLEHAETAAQKITQTAIAQPALFVIEYALAKLWMAWGIRPAAMIGHSIGEYVAATLAGVFSLEAALAIVAKRGQLMQELSPGQMLAIPLPENDVIPLLGEDLALAVVNGPSTCVVSGKTEAISALQAQLTSQGVNCRPLHTSHGFHSPMMDPILDSFKEQVQKFKLQSPTISYISNVTGDWITDEAATDPNYWASHLRQTVRFSDGLDVILQESAHVFLEVGPGRTLSTLLKQHSAKRSEQVVLTSLHHPKETQSDIGFILNAVGRLWLAGIQIDWHGFYAHEHRHRLPLPTYPFERQRYWLGATDTSSSPSNPDLSTHSLWQSLLKAGEKQAKIGGAALDEATYSKNIVWIDRLCLAYINSTLRQLGTFDRLETEHNLEDLCKHCQILPRYHQLVKSWLKALVRVGQLQQEGSSFKQSPSSPDDNNSTDGAIETLLKTAQECWIETPQMVDFVQLFGENLVHILVGDQEPLELFNRLIYHNQDVKATQKSPWEDYYRNIMRSILEKLTQALPSDTTLKILEIGAGTGIATSVLLPVLPHERTQYTFTDIGGAFLTQAQQKFADYPFIQYQLLDIEQSPKTQGFPLHEFDIVIAANVLHATQNIGETLGNVRSLVAPGGFLLLWEITQPQLNFEVTWGLLMKPFKDQKSDRTLGNPFLSSQEWQQALKNNAFTDVAVFPKDSAFGHSIILAKATKTTAPSLPSALATDNNQLGSQSPKQNLEQKPDVADWFYLPQWKRSLPPFSLQSTSYTDHSDCWLVFINEAVGMSIAEQLQQQKQTVITVQISEIFGHQQKALSDGSVRHSYTLNPEQKSDYSQLFESLQEKGIVPNHIVHGWTITSLSQPHSSPDQFDQIQSQGFYSLLFLVQTLGKQNWSQELQLTVLSNNMQSVTEEESIYYPEKTTILGLLKVIPQEYDYIRCRSIDISLTTTSNWQSKKLIHQLCAEILAPPAELIVAYRGLQRWVQTVEPITLKARPTEELPLKQSGVYLIVGGLGSLGLILAEYLARTVQAKLILTGRSSFPNREQWSAWLSSHEESDKISCQIRKIQEFESLGAEILILQADISNFEQMQAALSQTEQKFGALNGVIHAVVLGAAQLFKPIQDITPADCKLQFQGKIDGLFILQELLGSKSLDFCLLISSLASLFGGLGHAAYAAANLFMDAFAHQHNQAFPTPWLSVNWDGRKPVLPESKAIPLVETSSEQTILPEEDIKIFQHVLAWSQLNQIIVSTRELQPRVDYWTRWESLREEANLIKGNNDQSHHARPELENAYVPPRHATEKMLADIWQTIIGIDLVGIHDNYFELGGDSLISIQVMAQIRETFQVDLPSSSLFESPTVAGMANHINNIQTAKQLQSETTDQAADDREEIDL